MHQTIHGDSPLQRPPAGLAAIAPPDAHIGEYFGLWAIEEQRFQAAVDQFKGFDLRAHFEGQARQPAAHGTYRGDDYEVIDGVALIELQGPLMKYVSSLSGGTSTIGARRQISNAAANPEVRAILLRIDSPGGTVSGTADLASEVRRAAAAKPVHALIEDLGASAAYWVASQAGKVWAANQTTLVGSIGTYAVVTDYSGRAAQMGLKVHVIRSGAFKGSGEPGTEITPEQLGEWQRIVDEINSHFLTSVASGRRLSPKAVATLADGRVHLAEPAVGLHLVDGIRSLDEALSGLRAQPVSMSPSKRITSMSITYPEAASLEQLQQLVPNMADGFYLDMLRRHVSVEEAQREALVAKDKELAAAKATARPGAEPLRERLSGESSYDDSQAEWQRLLTEEVRRGRTHAQARVIVHRQHPGLSEAVRELQS